MSINELLRITAVAACSENHDLLYYSVTPGAYLSRISIVFPISLSVYMLL